MPAVIIRIVVAICLLLAVCERGVRADDVAVDLPAGVMAVWDLAKAYRQSSSSAERVCLNGLWRWQPANGPVEMVPSRAWGYFKVPGPWPGITDYMEKDSQTVHIHPAWKEQRLAEVQRAWYEREITIPVEWDGRTINVSAEYLNSYAVVYVDGNRAGEMRFPAGEVDITRFCRAGQKQILSLLVVAMPLKGVLLSYTDSASAREVKGAVARRGLCGDVYLTGSKPGPRIAEIKVTTSVRHDQISFDAALPGLAAGTNYTIRARVSEKGQIAAEFESPAFTSSELVGGHFRFSERWRSAKLWDIHTPQNQYEVFLTLLDAHNKPIDASAPVRFGFRELWIEGRDFYLNGTRIFLSAVPLDNAEVGVAWATYAAARESLERLKSFGINFVYTHNYGCEPGSHLSFAEILRAADDVGMLVSLSQPHFSHYDWKPPDADQTNGYARHAEFYAGIARNHPSVVFYSMSHNATGYNEDMNPDMIDGIQAPRDQWSSNNVKLALRAEAIVHRIDPDRIVYHHASGNLGSMHAINFYPNFVPIQELSDWFEHWATKGVKPAFMCEYGAPFTWDWTMYRGWYKGEREFGSAKVPWEFCLAEWNSQFFGDRAFNISEPEKANLRWEGRQFREGKLWHRWDYPAEVGSSRFDERYPLLAMYLTDNWRAFRGWGVSAISPWEYGHYWKLRDGVKQKRVELKVDWANLQRPGFSPDYIDQQFERIDMAYERKDWIATEAAQALIRNNGPLLAFIGGKAEAFTSKDHDFQPGQTIEKQLIVINNSRKTVTCKCDWSLNLARPMTGTQQIDLPTGDQTRIPLRLELPYKTTPGKYELTATVRFSNGETQSDSFTLDILPPSPAPEVASKIALFDPKGETAAWLKEKGIRFQIVEANSDLASYEILIVGKAALTSSNAAPDISRVSNGLKVLCFEQTAEALEKRFGFRVEEHGLRQVFPRIPDHPALAGITTGQLHDWRGAATLLPTRLTYEMRPRYGVTVKWCDLLVTRIWRCGNRGNIASVLIEKPTRGNFLPILDGGYSLQYSPLLEYREGKGMILFSQLDLIGRTEAEPAAEKLACNLIRYISTWKPAPTRNAVYVGDPPGKTFLESVGLALESYDSGKLSSYQAMIVGPNGGQILAAQKAEVAAWIQHGGNLLALGLNQSEANSFLPFQIETKETEHISTYFDPPRIDSPLVGVASADLHNRDPRTFPLISGGAKITGDGVLALAENANVTFCQIVPWQFETPQQPNLRRTFRRASFLISRLLGNMGVASSTPILSRFNTPVDATKNEKRWLNGLYLDQPEEWDDPYRFFRW